MSNGYRTDESLQFAQIIDNDEYLCGYLENAFREAFEDNDGDPWQTVGDFVRKFDEFVNETLDGGYEFYGERKKIDVQDFIDNMCAEFRPASLVVNLPLSQETVSIQCFQDDLKNHLENILLDKFPDERFDIDDILKNRGGILKNSDDCMIASVSVNSWEDTDSTLEDVYYSCFCYAWLERHVFMDDIVTAASEWRTDANGLEFHEWLDENGFGSEIYPSQSEWLYNEFAESQEKPKIETPELAWIADRLHVNDFLEDVGSHVHAGEQLFETLRRRSEEYADLPIAKKGDFRLSRQRKPSLGM